MKISELTGQIQMDKTSIYSDDFFVYVNCTLMLANQLLTYILVD